MAVISELLKEGYTYHLNGQYPEAEAVYRQILAHDPGHDEAYFLLSTVLVQTGDTSKQAEAQALLTTYLQKNQAQAEFYNKLGVQYFEKKAFPIAQKCYQKALRYNPNYFIAWNNLGNVYQETGHHQEAINHYLKAISIRPESPEVLYNTANAYVSAEALDEAVGYYQKAIEIQPTFWNAHLNLGKAYHQQNKLDEALATLETALSLLPNDPETLLSIGQVYSDQGDPQKAINTIELILKTQPSYAAAYFHIGQIFQKNNQFSDAENQYHLALKFSPEYEEAYFNLGVIYQKMESFDKAEQAYLQAIRLKPEHVEAYTNLAGALIRLSRLDEAYRYSEKALSLDPKSRWAYHNLGAILRERGNIEQAFEMFKQALNLKPDDAVAYHNLGILFQFRSEFTKAAECFKQATEIDPNFSFSWRGLADALADAGHNQESQDAYEKAIELNPRDEFKVQKAKSLPPIYQDTKSIQKWRKHFIRSIKALHKRSPLNIKNPMAQIGSANFFLAYHGENDKEPQELYTKLISDLDVWKTHNYQYNEKPKIGFISRFFSSEHTIGRLMLGIINQLPRDRFDVVVITVSSPESPPVTQPYTHINLSSTHFEVSTQTVADLNLDVLYYADIGMEPTTYFMAYNRLAPVQCVTWGHPVTTGIKTIDYFISSKLLETDEADDHYSEKLVRLETLPTYYYKPNVQPEQFTREHYGLSPTAHLYLCPQSVFKIHPDFDEIMRDILRKDPEGEILLLNAYCQDWNDLLMQRFRKSFPDVLDRLRILDRMTWHEFVGLMEIADVMLDTLYFGGGNTNYEAFALGTPIVTMPTDFMRGRVTHGCYLKMGIDDCIAETREAYVDIAVRIATQPDIRQSIKSRILEVNTLLYEDQFAVDAMVEFFEQAMAPHRAKALAEKESATTDHLHQEPAQTIAG